MNINILNYKLSKYEYLASQNPSNNLYAQKVSYYKNLVGGVSPIVRGATLVKAKAETAEARAETTKAKAETVEAEETIKNLEGQLSKIEEDKKIIEENKQQKKEEMNKRKKEEKALEKTLNTSDLISKRSQFYNHFMDNKKTDIRMSGNSILSTDTLEPYYDAVNGYLTTYGRTITELLNRATGMKREVLLKYQEQFNVVKNNIDLLKKHRYDNKLNTEYINKIVNKGFMSEKEMDENKLN